MLRVAIGERLRGEHFGLGGRWRGVFGWCGGYGLGCGLPGRRGWRSGNAEGEWRRGGWVFGDVFGDLS